MMPLRPTLALVLVAVASATDARAARTCFLLDGDAPSKPFPSLTQCYKQNQDACCVSAHDESIAGEYGGILSGTCVREFENLEQYYCLGCSPFADNFIRWYNTTTGAKGYHAQPTDILAVDAYALQDPGNSAMVSNQLKTVPGKMGEILLCKSFADKLLYGDGNGDSAVVDAYDGCGLMIGGNDMGELSRTIFDLDDGEKTAAGVAKSLKDTAPGGYFGASTSYDQASDSHNTGDSTLGAAIRARNSDVMISHQWKFFNAMRPPYYESDKFEISWYHTPTKDADGPGCFGAASGLQVASMSAALVAFVAHMLA